jgi:ornithine--oxo-acid transaminase
LLQLNSEYTRCEGVELTTTDGRTILDFLSGYCVHKAGHNHPEIIGQLQQERARRGPAMLQSHVPDLAGELAKRICGLAGGKLHKAFFACSGSEGVESAIKFARAATGRSGLLMGDDFWRGKFGAVLPGTCAIPLNDLSAVDKQLATKQCAAFFAEPIQSEARNPPAGSRLSERRPEFVCAIWHSLRSGRSADWHGPNGQTSGGASLWRRTRYRNSG